MGSASVQTEAQILHRHQDDADVDEQDNGGGPGLRPALDSVHHLVPGAQDAGRLAEHARRKGLIVRGVMGFGRNSVIHTAKILRLSEDLPMVIEIVDRSDKLEAFLPALDEMITDGLVTMERVKVLHYKSSV